MGRTSCVTVLAAAVSALASDTVELRDRRQRAAAAFADGILMVHAGAEANERADGFRQDPAFYYFTGLENTIGAILAIDGRSHESWLFLRSLGSSENLLAGVGGPLEGIPASDAVKQAGIEHVADWTELASFLEKNATPTPLYYSAVEISYRELPANITGDPQNTPLWAIAIARKWPQLQFKDVRSRINALMDVQSPTELVNVRAAAKATVQAVMAGIRAVRPGVSQRMVETAVADACWKAGAHGISFWPWAMAGPNSVFPNPFASLIRYDHLDAIMRPGDLVRLDVGCEWNHYGGDLGRTVPVSGRYSADQREVWDMFVSAYHAGVRSLHEGATPNQVFDAWRTELLRHKSAAKSTLARQAVEEWSKQEKVPFWQIHTMNLSVGDVEGPMRAGTTIAFEPIASIGGQGYYLEDLYVITKEGADLLTPGVPYSADEIEATMRSPVKMPASHH